MSTPEQRFSTWFLKHARAAGWFCTRIETSTTNGVPDIHCTIPGFGSVWFEMKAGTKVRKEQKLWHRQHWNHGGYSFVLEKTQGGYALYAGIDLECIQAAGTSFRHLMERIEEITFLWKNK